MITSDKFKDWLDDENQALLTFQNGDTFNSFIKVPKSDGFYYLYNQNNYRGEYLTRNRNFEYVGIYDQVNGHIYDSNRQFQKVFPDLEHSETLGQMAQTVTGTVQQLIWQTLGNDRTKLRITELSEEMQKNFDNYASDVVNGKARELFLRGESSSEIRGYECDFEFNEWSEKDLLKYIRNPTEFVNGKATEFIETHQEDILWTFLKNDKIADTMKQMEAEEDGPLRRLRNIMTAMNNSSAKTVSVTVNKDGIECTFKTEASELRRDPFSYYSTWNMATPDRYRFEKTYGRHSHYTPEEIVDISYRGNSIYSAEPYESKQDVGESEGEDEGEDQGFTMSM